MGLHDDKQTTFRQIFYMITEDHVSFEVAKLLKEKGFDEPCALSEFDCDAYKKWVETAPRPITLDAESEKPFRYPVPSIYVAKKWVKEKYKRHIEVRITNHSISDMVNVIKYYSIIFNSETPSCKYQIPTYKLGGLYNTDVFDTEEEAYESALRHLLENLD